MMNTAIKTWQSNPNLPGSNVPLFKEGKRYEQLASSRLDSSYIEGAVFKNTNFPTEVKKDAMHYSVNFLDLSEGPEKDFAVVLHVFETDEVLKIGYNQDTWYIDEVDNRTTFEGEVPLKNEVASVELIVDSNSEVTLIINDETIVDKHPVSYIYDAVKQEPNLLNVSLLSFESGSTRIAVEVPLENATELYGEQPTKNPADAAAETDTIASEQMTVTIDKAFPRVVAYDYKGKKLSGEPRAIREMMVNDYVIQPTVSYKKVAKDQAEYELSYQSDELTLDFTMTLVLKVNKNELHLDFAEIENRLFTSEPGKEVAPAELLRLIDMVDNALITVTSNEDEAQFVGSTMSVNTHHSGDVFIDLDGPIEQKEFGAMYGFVSNKELAAGVWSNSQYSYGGITEDYTRLSVLSQTIEGENSVGVNSAPWLYQREHKGTAFDERTYILPSAKVVVTDDLNDDGKVDWQDAAIAYRAIMNNPYGYETVPDVVGYRINMNFGSHAQNPFLKVLDGIKRVWLNTDGLGQGILMKGYGNEGHDSAHLNYIDIGQRMGGMDDMQFLMERAKRYGANLGVHINISETYPESPVISEDLLRRTKDGGFKYGWNWIDQGINIDSAYDLAHGRYDRLKAFKELTRDGLEFIYVDVWGNFQSGDERAWYTHRIAKELNSLGWRFALEWGQSGEYDSTWNHWAVDMPYGGFNYKGVNSAVARFIRNHQKDTFIGDYVSYGGAANSPLLGGYELNDFEGWQGRSNFKSYLETLYKVNVPTKFVQHFKVMKWVNGDPVEMEDNDEKYTWLPEMAVHLKDDDGNVLLIERGSNDVHAKDYRKRTFTLNDVVIYEDDAYLLPWKWAATGEELSKRERKLYYYNLEADETKWDVSAYNLGTKLYVYELSDKGKINEQVLPVENGQVTLSLDAKTPYVLYAEPQEQEDVVWSEKMHVKDADFNSLSLEDWTIEGEEMAAEVVYSQGYNPMLRIQKNEETIVLKQKLVDLKPNTKYAVSVNVDNRSDAQAILAIQQGEKRISNYTDKSIAKNYVKAEAHNTLKENATVDDTSYFQTLSVYFTTGEQVDDVFIILQREPETKATYFDDIRVVENESAMFDGQHDTKDASVFEQDFEHVDRGLFPFVVGNSEGVEDNRIHLSEKNEPYTGRGWNEKLLTDVISGDWSLKVNGLVGKEKLVFHTIPQNIRFEPGVTYEVSFDYEAGTDNAYAIAVGAGDTEVGDRGTWELTPLQNTWEHHDEPQSITFTLTGDDSGQTWFGIYSTDVKADTHADSGSHAIFRGYSDFVLDNISIRKMT